MELGGLLIGCKLNFSTFGVLIRQSILKVSTFNSLGFGLVSLGWLQAQTLALVTRCGVWGCRWVIIIWVNG